MAVRGCWWPIILIAPMVALAGCAALHKRAGGGLTPELPRDVMALIRRGCQDGYFDPLEARLKQQPSLRGALLQAVRCPRCAYPPKVRELLARAIHTGDWIEVATYLPARQVFWEQIQAHQNAPHLSQTRPASQPSIAVPDQT